MGSCFLPPFEGGCSGLPKGCGSCIDECSSKRTEKGKCETVFGKIMDEYCTQVPLPKEKCEILHDFMNVALCKEKEKTLKKTEDDEEEEEEDEDDEEK